MRYRIMTYIPGKASVTMQISSVEPSLFADFILAQDRADALNAIAEKAHVPHRYLATASGFRSEFVPLEAQ